MRDKEQDPHYAIVTIVLFTKQEIYSSTLLTKSPNKFNY